MVAHHPNRALAHFRRKGAVRFVMAPSSQKLEPPGNPGRFSTLPVTPETCELFLGPVRRTQLWDFERPFKADTVLKDWVELHGGVPNCETVERIAERLYRDDEQSLDRMLLAKAEVIAAAMGRHVEGAADGASRKRAAFLRRMRS